MRTPTRIDEDGEVEKLCGICKEYWPLDIEFFAPNSYNGKLTSPCRACIADIHHRCANKPCNVPGCFEPRYSKATAYCRDHHYEIRLRRPPPKRANRKAVAS